MGVYEDYLEKADAVLSMKKSGIGDLEPQELDSSLVDRAESCPRGMSPAVKTPALSQGLFPAAKACDPVAEEPGYFSAIGQGLYSGFRRRVPEMVGQALQFSGVAPDTGKAVAEWGTKEEERPEFKNPVKSALYQGAEMVAPSAAIPMAIGAAISPIGLSAGATAMTSSLAAATLFGLSQGQQTYEEALKNVKDPGTKEKMAAWANALIRGWRGDPGDPTIYRRFLVLWRLGSSRRRQEYRSSRSTKLSARRSEEY